MSSGSIDLGSTVTTATPSGAAGGDLGGNYPNPTVQSYSGTTISVPATAGLAWQGGAPSTAGAVFGTSGTGSSALINTPSLNANFSSGVAVDGSFALPLTSANVRALGVNSPGGYNSEMNLYTTFELSSVLNLKLNSDSTTTSYGGVILSTSGSRPTAGAAYRGMLFVTQGGGGVADTLSICLKASGGTYSWKDIITG